MQSFTISIINKLATSYGYGWKQTVFPLLMLSGKTELVMLMVSGVFSHVEQSSFIQIVDMNRFYR